MVRRTVRYRGTVQGVGFRWTTQRIAARYRIVGTVRNLPSGEVEVVAEGERAEIARFLAELEDRMSGYIHRRTVDEGEASGGFSAFRIVH